ncbi:MAG: VCBS repeat-containing protein [Deltaproteobacteria bacterium]|nr:VCBS repeat-containing protein [Nannocystaceae bacterium]
MSRWWFALALVGCGPRSGGGASYEGETTSGIPPVADETTTTGPSSELCLARRYSLLDDEQCHHAAIGDLDADGQADLAVFPGPQSFFSGSVLRRLHTFRGGATELQVPEIHCCLDVGGPASLGLIDVNGDARMDPLYVVNHDYVVGDVGGTMGSLDLQVRGPLGGYLPERAVAHGRLHHLRPLVAIGALAPDRPAVVVSDAEAELRVLFADGISLEPTTSKPLMLPSNASALGTTDLDADGIDDVVALLPDRLALVRSAGDGTLTLLGETTPPILGPTMIVGDLDGVGGRDIVLVGDQGIAVGLVSPDAIAWHAQPELVITSPAVLADVDGDEALDLVTVEGTTLVAYRRGGDVTFAAAPLVVAHGVGDAVRTIVAGDLDGDARADLAVCDGLGVLVVSSGGAP